MSYEETLACPGCGENWLHPRATLFVAKGDDHEPVSALYVTAESRCTELTACALPVGGPALAAVAADNRGLVTVRVYDCEACGPVAFVERFHKGNVYLERFAGDPC